MWELWGVEISPLPLKRHIAYTTACCYRTSRDDKEFLVVGRGQSTWMDVIEEKLGPGHLTNHSSCHANVTDSFARNICTVNTTVGFMRVQTCSYISYTLLLTVRILTVTQIFVNFI